MSVVHRLDFLAFSEIIKSNLVQAEIHFLKTLLNYLKELVEEGKVAQDLDRDFVRDMVDHNPMVVVPFFLDQPLSMVVVATFRPFSIATYSRYN